MHAFAAQLGLNRNIFQPGKPTGPQQTAATGCYYLTEGEHDQAVALGAQVITPRELAKMEQQRATWLGDG